MGRRICVGDIQGCRERLQRLLDAVQFALGSDRLLPAGDLVNKGPDSPGTLARLMQLGAEPVLGNYDLHWLRKAKDQEPAQRAWRPQSAAFPPREHTAPPTATGQRPRLRPTPSVPTTARTVAAVSSSACRLLLTRRRMPRHHLRPPS